MVNNRASEIQFTNLIENIVSGVVEGQVALDLNGIATDQLLSDTTLPAKSIIVAIVETVDQDGNITNIETLLNEQPISLADLGLSPVFLQISETNVFFQFVTYLREINHNLRQRQGIIQGFDTSTDKSQNNFNEKNRFDMFLNLFKRPEEVLSNQVREELHRYFRLTVTSATSIAIGSKFEGGGFGAWRMKATIRPQNMSLDTISEVEN